MQIKRIFAYTIYNSIIVLPRSLMGFIIFKTNKEFKVYYQYNYIHWALSTH